jgi:CelD/BcsL family acetyltransferase involved in cellulose biosynthesis/2-polyprenyl-3-methyl-5-hydroxy-6-metoxy-1,4-benzoquinol methylase
VRAAPEIVDLGDAGRLAPLVDDWRALALELGGGSYFQTPDWILSWWATLGGRAPGSVAAWRGPSGRLDALVALSRSRERLHRRTPLAVPVYANAGSGPGAADHCGWLVRPERAAEVAAWVSEAIGSSALLVRSAAADWPGARMLPAGARVVEATPCPSVELPLAPARGGPSATFIRQLRRFTRRLARDGVTFSALAPTQVDDRLLTTLFALHAEGRADRGGTGFGVEQLALHRMLVERAGPNRGPAAVVARRDEAIVGVLYGFWWDDTFAAYQSGWDRRYARDSLGNVLILHALELAAAQGARSFDFLRGVEPYKYRFGAHDRWDRTWLVPRGPAGALLVARHRARRRRRPVAARTPEQLRRHYEIERRLGDRLRRSTREERTRLYSEVYDELFRSVPDHPQLRWRADPRLRAARVERHLQTIERFLPAGGTYLEVGAGDCALAARVAARAGKVYAIDVSEEIAAPAGRPANLEVVITDGRSIPVAPGTAHVAFSDQLMEHLHPEDAAEQLANLHRALAPGGAYLCITPNRLSGPHDISRRFDAVATGLHLKEYTSRELAILMRRAGFTTVRTFLTVGGRTVTAPVAAAEAIERLARGPVGRRLAHERLGARALGNRIVAFK